MRKMQDLSGMVFGRLTVLRLSKVRRYGGPAWVCQCVCGTVKIVGASNLRGKTRSCGCFNKERRTTHDLSRHPLYMTWVNMVRRCGNMAYGKSYVNVNVFKEWKDSVAKFVKYVSDNLGKKPSAEHSIDRIDTSGDYVPGNIRWATKLTQSNNRRYVRLFEYGGEKGTARYFADKYGMKFATLRTRLRKGMTICQALQTPLSEPHVRANLTRPSGRGRRRTVQTEE